VRRDCGIEHHAGLACRRKAHRRELFGAADAVRFGEQAPARVVWLRVAVSLPLPFLAAWAAMLTGRP